MSEMPTRPVMLVVVLCLMVMTSHALADGVSFPGRRSVCPPGWLAWRNACYILLPGQMSWWRAKEVCDRPGSSLVVPRSQEEHDFVWREMRSRMVQIVGNTEPLLQLWIGCTDFENTGRVTCLGIPGEPEYTNGNFESDSSAEAEGQGCVCMAEQNEGRWGDTMCETSKFAACKMLGPPAATYCLQAGAGGRFSPRCLLNHQIKNLTAEGVVGCGQACWAEPPCHSFNLWQEGDDKKVCQLNNATSTEADPASWGKVKNCSFFDL